MSLKYTTATLNDVPAPLREHYVAAKDGGFQLAIEGHPDTAKKAEFRETNIRLAQELDALKARFEGIDPEAVKADRAKLAQFESAKPDARIAELEAQLVAERAANAAADQRAARARVRDWLRLKALAMGALPAGVEMLLDKGEGAFRVVNDSVQAQENRFSKSHPGELVTAEDWLTEAALEFPFLFEKSIGGGARNSGSVPPSSPNELVNPDAKTLGARAADIAAGRVRVVYTT